MASQWAIQLGHFFRGLVCAGLSLVMACGPANAADLPGPQQVASRLASTDARLPSLLRLAVVFRHQQRYMAGETGLGPDSQAQDEAWLSALVTEFGPFHPRGPVLDSAAWPLYLQLEKRQLSTGELTSPMGASLDSYLRTAFDRDERRIAAAVIPAMLWRLEAEAMNRYDQLLAHAGADDQLATQLGDALVDWRSDPFGRGAQEVSHSDWAALSSLVLASVLASPPDHEQLERLRFGLHMQLIDPQQPELAQVRALLHLAGIIDGLHEANYLAFAEGLLAIAGEWVQSPSLEMLGLATWLDQELPMISTAYARRFAAVDPAINNAIATAFGIARAQISRQQELSGDEAEAQAQGSDAEYPGADLGLIEEMADAVAQLGLLIPDVDYYFGLPVRDSVAGSVEACTGLTPIEEEKPSGMTREMFDDCLSSLLQLAEGVAAQPALSGDASGPFGSDELKREVGVTAQQRINYSLGYLHDRFPNACELPDEPLPNPIEWSSLANVMTWLAEQFPIYFRTPENEERLRRMTAIGTRLVQTTGAQSDCFFGTGSGETDPISRSLANYQEALAEFNRGIRASIAAFRDTELAAGSDIKLERDANQSTTFRPQDEVVGPCDPEQVCEMKGPLTSQRALWGLFPDSYLVAAQSRMGSVQLCYQNMEWVDRRSEPVRPGDTNVANYFGRLQFDLKGRFVRQDRAEDVFGFRFTTPDEYHYLFAAADEAVLEDSCPMEWVGSRIVTEMKESRAGIVPNRLTYLAAPRTLPSRLLATNWDKGAEWRDWFITGLGVEALGPEVAPEIGPELNEHLQALYRAEQAAVYRGMLVGEENGRDNEGFEQLENLTLQKDLLRLLMSIFHPQALIDNDAIRSSVSGQAGLLDAAIIFRFRRDNLPLNSIGALGIERLGELRTHWRELPEMTRRGGTVEAGLVHAVMRLKALYLTQFSSQSVTRESADSMISVPAVTAEPESVVD